MACMHELVCFLHTMEWKRKIHSCPLPALLQHLYIYIDDGNDDDGDVYIEQNQLNLRDNKHDYTDNAR